MIPLWLFVLVACPGWGFAAYLCGHLYDGPWVKYKKEPPSHGWDGKGKLSEGGHHC